MLKDEAARKYQNISVQDFYNFPFSPGTIVQQDSEYKELSFEEWFGPV